MRQKARIWRTACLAVGCLWMGSFCGWASPADGGPSGDRLARSVTHYILGVRYDLLGDQASAVREYARAVHYDGSGFSPNLRLGMGYARLGLSAKAIDQLETASHIDPQDLQPHYFLALLYSSLQNIPRATQEYELLLKGLVADDPRNTDLFSYLGQLYYSQGQEDKAREQFERILDLDPKNTRALYIVASSYLDGGRRQEAADLLKRCIAQDPLDEGCLNSLSYTYAEDGIHLDEALDLVGRALEIRPEDPAFLDTRGWVYYQKEMYPEALKDLTRAADLLQDPTIFDHLGDVAFKLNNVDAARQYWQESLDLDPDQLGVRSKLESLSSPLKTPTNL